MSKSNINKSIQTALEQLGTYLAQVPPTSREVSSAMLSSFAKNPDTSDLVFAVLKVLVQPQATQEARHDHVVIHLHDTHRKAVTV